MKKFRFHVETEFLCTDRVVSAGYCSKSRAVIPEMRNKLANYLKYKKFIKVFKF